MTKEQKAEHVKIATDYESTFTKAKKILNELLQEHLEEGKLPKQVGK